MRLPVRSERDAFRIAWSTAALAVAAIALGILIHPLVGVGLFAMVVLAALVWDVLSPNPDAVPALREAATIGRSGGAHERKRLLVVANQTLPGEELRRTLRELPEPRPELRIVVPILISRVRYVMSDIDSELVLAHRRLDETLEWARAEGFPVSGEVCPEGPLTAIGDELRQFAADEIVISTHPPERSNWLEAGVVERAREQLDIPVKHVIVDLAAASPTSAASY